MITESRVKSGSLTIDGVDYSCQPTAVAIEPENEGSETETLEVLCGESLTSTTPGTLSANLTITAIQDFTAATGSLIGYAWTNNGTEQPFTWSPTADAEDAWNGTVVVRAVTVGGEVNTRLDTDAEWPITALQMPTKLGGAWVIGSAPVGP